VEVMRNAAIIVTSRMFVNDLQGRYNRWDFVTSGALMIRSPPRPQFELYW
jgi:hypothetical protein